MATAFVYDHRFLDHDTGVGHPEQPARLTRALAQLHGAPWFPQLQQVTAQPADPIWIETVHSLAYMRRAAAACRAGHDYLDVQDVAISARSYEVATLAVGAALALADEVCAGRSTNGFALLRPPGHHAEHATALGFCLFNNIAILARYLQRRYGLDKIAIVDWDVHHGNGTQHCFEEDPSVLYVSLHQYPYYPGTGSADETGRGRGRGATLNCPMPAGATDTAYELAFSEQVLPRLALFKPEAILISAGFDAHRDDPLADVRLSTACYGWMTARLNEIAEHYAAGRILSLLEGGYHLTRTAESIELHVGTLAGVLDG